MTRHETAVLEFPTSRVHVGDAERVPPPSRAPEPYETRIRFGVNGVAELIGYDRRGDAILELRVPVLPQVEASSKIGSAFRALLRTVDELKWNPTPEEDFINRVD